MPLSAGTHLGTYEILASLGAGGMGEVYRARDTKLGRDVAVKILPPSFVNDPERVARFQREAQLLASLNHPHIAAIHGLEETAGSQFLVLELVDGETLAQRIAHGPLPLPDALAIARQIAEALEAAHDRGIVHRDLKPANIALTRADQVKVLDFGLAKLEGGATAASGTAEAANSPTLTFAATQAGVILGTAAYMAPEQAKGRPADKRADIWAFGCVLYEMLTGKRAFEGDDASDTLAAVLRAEVDWSALPRDTPDQIRLLLKRCLEKDRHARVSEIAIARFLMTESIAPAPVAAATRSVARHWTPRRIALVAIVGLLAAVSLGGASVWTTVRWMARTPQVTRFAIVPPSTQPFNWGGVDRDLAISPDGAHIVYRSFINGQTQFVTRDNNQLEGHPVGGVDGARSPFISPDGHWLGYFAAAVSELRKVPMNGGPPITLCRFSGSPQGATWGDDDTIVFATDDPGTGLLSVSAAGGEPRPLTKPDSSAEADHLFPAFIAGTNTVLFAVVGRAASTQEIAALDVKSGARKVLVRGGGQVEFVGPEYLVYAASGTLRSVRFDASRLEVRSDPVPVLDGVSVIGNGAANFAVSRGGTLTYATGGAVDPPRQLVWVDRHGREESLVTVQRAFADPRISPDGRQITIEIEDTHDDVWTLDIARGALTRQTFEDAEDETPRWSPDGKWLAYSSTRGGKRMIFRRRSDGSGSEEELWSGANHTHLDDWTPDNRALLVTSSTASAGVGAGAGLNDILLIPLAHDTTPKPLLNTRFNERGARVSPDGHWLSYTSDESGMDEVYVRPFPSLEGKTQISIGGGAEAVWSAKGDELFYLGGGSLMAVRIGPGPSFSASSPAKVFANHYYSKAATHISYDVARDGKRFLMVKEVTNQQTGNSGGSLVVVLNWIEELKARMASR